MQQIEYLNLDDEKSSEGRHNRPSRSSRAGSTCRPLRPSVTAEKETTHEKPAELMSAVLDRPNMQRAYRRVLKQGRTGSGRDGGHRTGRASESPLVRA